jgi:hypothetical protein
MPASDVFRDRFAEGIHREGVGDAYDVAFAGRVIAVRDVYGRDRMAVERTLEEKRRMGDAERVEPATGVVPGEAEVIRCPNREAEKIAGQVLVADTVDRGEILSTKAPPFGQEMRPLSPEALGPAAGGVIASIGRAGVKISIRIAGGVLAVHFLRDDDVAALEDREIADDLVVGSSARAPGKMGCTVGI